MEEIKRVLFTKRRILLLVILVLYSAIQCCRPMFNDYMQQERKGLDVFLEDYQGMTIEEIKQELDSLTNNGSTPSKLGMAGFSFYDQVKHINDYPAFLENIQEQAGTLLGVSIFMNSDETVLKTAADYKRMEGVQLSLGHDSAVTSVLWYDTADWLLGGYIIIIVLSFMNERKRGMWNLVCASPGGRVALPLYRLLSLLIAATLGAVLFTGVEICSGWLVSGGANEMNRIVQSVSLLKGFTVPMTIGQFWIFYTGLRIAGVFMIGMVVWLFFEVIPDRRLAAIAFALFAGLEWVLYKLLPGNYLLDTVNLFMCLSPRNLLLSYEVLNPFGLAFGRIDTYLLAAAGVTVISTAVVLLCCRFRKPNSGLAWLMRLADLWRRYTAAIGFHGKLFFHELHKLLVIGRGIIVLLAALLIAVNVAEQPYLGGNDPFVNQSLEAYYRQSQGPLSEENEVFLQEQHQKLDDLRKEADKLRQRYMEGYISDREYSIQSMQYADIPEKEAALEQYAVDLQTLSSVDNAHIVPHWVYSELFGIGSNTVDTLQVLSLLAVSLICILYSSTEASTGMTKARRATLRGRNQALMARYSAGWLLTAVVCAAIWGAQFWLLSASYEGLPYLNAPIYCLHYFRSLPQGLSILGYWTLLTAGRTALLCLWSSLLLWILDRLQK